MNRMLAVMAALLLAVPSALLAQIETPPPEVEAAWLARFEALAAKPPAPALGAHLKRLAAAPAKVRANAATEAWSEENVARDIGSFVRIRGAVAAARRTGRTDRLRCCLRRGLRPVRVGAGRLRPPVGHDRHRPRDCGGKRDVRGRGAAAPRMTGRPSPPFAKQEKRT